MWKDDLNSKGLEFTLSFKDNSSLKKNNLTLAVNVYRIDRIELYQLRISDFDEEQDRDIHLLLIKGDGWRHCCLIENISRLVSNQIAEHGHEIYLCYRCLNHFRSKDVLKAHKEYRVNHKWVNIKMPSQGAKQSFETTPCRWELLLWCVQTLSALLKK